MIVPRPIDDLSEIGYLVDLYPGRPQGIALVALYRLPVASRA